MSREGSRTTDQIQAYCNGMVRRMVSLPRNIIGEVSRAITNGRNLMTIETSQGTHSQNSFTDPRHFIQDPLHSSIPAEWVFLTTFERQYDQLHPFFYACKLMEALKIAEQEHKLLFMYFHSPEHPFTASFCRNTLCSEVVVEYIDANFVSWGGLASRGEGYQMAMEMRIQTFPFCAVVAPGSDSSLAVLHQVEGPVSPTELVEILQATMEEQGRAFGNNNQKQSAEIRRVREEQDAAYLASLQIDSEKDKSNELPIERTVQQNPRKEHNKANDKHKQPMISGKEQQETSKLKETVKNAQGRTESTNCRGESDTTQILIRFPNGERREKSFQSTDKIQSVYKYIDSLNLPGVVGYRLISSFPRKVFGFEQMGMSLKDAGLHPRSSLFLELL